MLTLHLHIHVYACTKFACSWAQRQHNIVIHPLYPYMWISYMYIPLLLHQTLWTIHVNILLLTRNNFVWLKGNLQFIFKYYQNFCLHVLYIYQLALFPSSFFFCFSPSLSPPFPLPLPVSLACLCTYVMVGYVFPSVRNLPMLIVHGCQRGELVELRRRTQPHANIKLLQVSPHVQWFLCSGCYSVCNVRFLSGFHHIGFSCPLVLWIFPWNQAKLEMFGTHHRYNKSMPTCLILLLPSLECVL